MADAVFLALSVITIGSAIAALEMRSLIYGSIALMGTLGGIAGFFFLLDAPFVALFQLAVYVGSIAVLILFTVMLVKRELIFKKIEDRRRKFAGIGLMLIIMVSAAMHFGGNHIYHWMEDGIMKEFLLDDLGNSILDDDGDEIPNPTYDKIIAGKEAFLNTTFFLARSVFYILGWIYFGRNAAMR